ncbi:MAG: phosphoribosyl-AMP cyclohydrolase [Verrucomicrobiae bacterium]|nr:phosphoribosyl-AMP cyclohydrolase [Verrucomicrobiae bacterium]
MKVLWPNFAKRDGICVAIAQDFQTKQILMQGYVDEAGYRETLKTGEAVYYSTSRKKRWKKGETSGDIQIVHNILIDCDGDSIIYVVEQKGQGACHTQAKSCYYRDYKGNYSEKVKESPADTLPTQECEVHPRLN